jgi:hypothetical protein
MKKLTEAQALQAIRAMATQGTPKCINLDAIDRILAQVEPAQVQVFPPACPVCHERPAACICELPGIIMRPTRPGEEQPAF